VAAAATGEASGPAHARTSPEDVTTIATNIARRARPAAGARRPAGIDSIWANIKDASLLRLLNPAAGNAGF
jgi:hypothetical protein